MVKPYQSAYYRLVVPLPDKAHKMAPRELDSKLAEYIQAYMAQQINEGSLVGVAGHLREAIVKENANVTLAAGRQNRPAARFSRWEYARDRVRTYRQVEVAFLLWTPLTQGDFTQQVQAEVKRRLQAT